MQINKNMKMRHIHSIFVTVKLLAISLQDLPRYKILLRKPRNEKTWKIEQIMNIRVRTDGRWKSLILQCSAGID